MSSRSDIGFAIKASVVIPKQIEQFMEHLEAETYSIEAGTLYVIRDVHWSEGVVAVQEFYAWLKSIDQESFIVREACFDYPESDEMCRGEWLDNPWKVRRIVQVAIEFEVP